MFSDKQKIRFSAMNMLSCREQSRAELELKLAAKHDKNLVVEVVDALANEGLQSDQRFLESFVSSRVGRGVGPIKISYELRHKGIDPELIAYELEKYHEQWLDIARKQLHKKYGDELPEDFKDKQKRQRFIASRGFSQEICYQLFD